MMLALCFALAALLGALFGNWRVTLVIAAIIAIMTSPIEASIGLAAGVLLARRRWPP